MFLNRIILKRGITTSAAKLQQQSFTQRAAPRFGFGQMQQQQPDFENNSYGEMDTTNPEAMQNKPMTSSNAYGSSQPSYGRYGGSGAAISGSSYSSAGLSKSVSAVNNPFPEELDQDYSSEMFPGASTTPFSSEVINVLNAELSVEDIEIKPDGALYLPESRYRKVLNKAFGVGGWCLIPRGPHTLSNGVLSREYALFCQGRFVSQARGHSVIQGFSNPAMASESARSNAIMRVCKDLGIGNELWDPAFVGQWKTNFARSTNVNGKIKWIKNTQ